MASQATTTPSKPRQPSGQKLLFIDNYNGTTDAPQDSETVAQKRSIRAQAARASSNARLETIRKRAERRTGTGQPAQPQRGRRAFPVDVVVDSKTPLPLVAVEQHENAVIRYRKRDASAALFTHTLLGGSIPVAQANVGILSQFLQRFQTGRPTERPWIELVLTRSASSATPSLVAQALQANATALCANDLRSPEVRKHATKLYLSTITQLQSSLRSPNWRDPIIMHTAMILTLYECIQSSTPAAQQAHVSGVAHLIEQRGPHNFIHGLEHKTFRYFRINILMVCLADRRPCFLAETAWKTTPFSGDCPPKTMFDVLIDILVEIPGVLDATEILRKGDLGRCALLQKAFELAYWVRRLIYSLERWKEEHIWTDPAIHTASNLKDVDILTLCELGTSIHPYDARLGEALNCYMAAHLILGRIAQRLSDTSFILRSALSTPYPLRDLVAAIALVSERHTGAEVTDMISMIVTTFPLKVAQSTTEVDEPKLFKTLQELLDRVNEHFMRRYNIHYSVQKETKEYEV